MIQLSRYSDGVRTGGPGSDSWQGQKIFLFSPASTRALRPTQLPIQWVSTAVSARVKQQGRDADHSPSSNDEVKKGEAINQLPSTSSWRGAFQLCCLNYAKLAYSQSLSNSSSPDRSKLQSATLKASTITRPKRQNHTVFNIDLIATGRKLLSYILFLAEFSEYYNIEMRNTLSFTLILYSHTHLSLPSGYFPSDFPIKIFVCSSLLCHACIVIQWRLQLSGVHRVGWWSGARIMMNLKELEGNGCVVVAWRVWGKPQKFLSQDSRSPGKNLNRERSEYKCRGSRLNQPVRP
jgi:hypothetical protein